MVDHRVGTSAIALYEVLRQDAVGRELLRFVSFAVTQAPHSSAQLAQDAWVLFETNGKRDGYFVEFGAADGVLLSNTYLLERHHGWTGCLAEPCPDDHAALATNRPACYLSQKGVGPTAGEFVMTVAPDRAFSTFEAFSTKDLHAYARAGGYSVTLPVQTFNALLHDAGAPREIDYLSIDTEGSELQILQSLDWQKYRIQLITVEHNYTEARDNIHAFLSGLGYRRKFEELSLWDDWYVLQR